MTTKSINKADVKDLKGQVVGSVDLPDPVFTDHVKSPLLWETVKAYLANRRQGTASTKTRGQVRGGGRKPWKQKGTGRARQSSIRSPLWRGGGVVFGPHPRDYHVSMPKNLRRGALISSLQTKWKDGAVTIVKNFQLASGKTKEIAAALAGLKADKSTLVLLEKQDSGIARAARNIRGVTVKPAQEATAYDVLSHHNIIVSEAGFRQLQELKGQVMG
ncbi:MAG: 50S ribosomal protein L4 [Candidatus Omnitrophica bacterium]|nr:50S ribosomal protein L4 [Candidatus Omnitrophota bacterium]